MKLIEIQNILEEWSPLENSEYFDNVGLIIGNPNSEVNGALITIDVTENVIAEAINLGYNLIITFHPLMYKGSNKLNQQTETQNLPLPYIKNFRKWINKDKKVS